MTKKLPLRKTQKNDVLRLLQRHGLDAAGFAWGFRLLRQDTAFVGGAAVQELVHEPTGYFVVFDFRQGELADKRVLISPGVQDHEEAHAVGGWTIALVIVNRWAHELRKELDAPDLWAEFLSARAVAADIAELPAAQAVTREERTGILEAVESLKADVARQAEMDAVGLRYVAARLDDLAAASESTDRRSFLYAAIGVAFTIAVGLAPEHARLVFSMIVSRVRVALGLGEG